MNQLLALFLPSVISCIQIEKCFGESKNVQQMIIRYIVSVLFINIIMYGLMIYIVNKPYFIFTNQFTLKYIIISTVLAYILPIIVKYIKETVSINFRVKKNER